MLNARIQIRIQIYSREICLFNILPAPVIVTSVALWGNLARDPIENLSEPSNPLANRLPIVRRISTADRSQSIEFHACTSLLTYRVKYVRAQRARAVRFLSKRSSRSINDNDDEHITDTATDSE